MNDFTNITLSTKNGEVILAFDGDKVVGATVYGRTVMAPYHDLGYMVAQINLEFGIFVMSRQEVEEIALNGGEVRLFADDLYIIKVLPSWWGVEFDMTMEGDTPNYPMSEDITDDEASEAAAYRLIASVMEALLNPKDWEVEEE